MFANAKKIAAPANASKAKAAAKLTDTFPGLAEFAALDACAKAIAGLLEMKKNALKEVATTLLLERGLARHSQPDNLSLKDGENATGKAYIRRKASTSPLNADELEMLASITDAERDEEGNIIAIPGFVEMMEKSPEMLAVNSAYANDEALLKKIDKALNGIKGIPEDFIVMHEAQTKAIVSETATDALFRLDAEAAEAAFPIIAGVTISAAFGDMGEAWKIVKPMIAPAPEATKANLKKMLTASLKA